mgnify:CR=1 FL=1
MITQSFYPLNLKIMKRNSVGTLLMVMETITNNQLRSNYVY